MCTKPTLAKMTDGLFLDAFREAAKKRILKSRNRDVIVDNCCMQLVRNPAQF